MSGTCVRRSVVAVIGVFLLQAAPAYSSHNGVPVPALAIDPVTPNTIYAGTPGGMFKSTDGGATWSASPLVNTISALAFDPQNPSIVYAGGFGRVLKSTNGGASWNRTGSLPSGVFAFDPLVPTTIYAGTVGTYSDDLGDLYKSTDAGASWSRFGLFFGYAAFCNPCGGVSSLAIAPLTIFGRTEAFASSYEDGSPGGEIPPGVIQSTDGGANWAWTWSASNLGNVVYALATDPLIPTTRYAGTDTGVYKSTDGGASWNAVGLTGAIALAIDPLTPTTLYAGSTDRVYKSTDGGTSWSAIGLTGAGDILALAIDSLTPTTLYAGSGTSGVYKSTDGGASWNPVGPIAWSHVSSVRLNPTSVAAGNPSTGTVTLSAAAPAGGAVVELATGYTDVATVPASVTVPAGATSADFTVSTRPRDSAINVFISAASGGETSSAVLTVTPSLLSSLSLNPTSVIGGAASIGTVSLSTTAPTGGAVVTLASSNTAVATVPASVTVPAGATSTTFTVSTGVVTTATPVTIQAANFSTTLNVIPATTLSFVSLNPASVIAENSSSGTVTLSAPSPAGGAVIALVSGNAVVSVPTSVTVAVGATSATFTASTSSLSGCASLGATISATYGGVTRSAALTVIPAMDAVAIQQADYFAGRHELRIAATSTGLAPTLQAYVTSTGALIGTLRHYDGTRYSGRFAWPVNPQNITVRSSLCGSATKAVTSK